MQKLKTLNKNHFQTENCIKMEINPIHNLTVFKNITIRLINITNYYEFGIKCNTKTFIKQSGTNYFHSDIANFVVMLVYMVRCHLFSIKIELLI